MELLLTSPIASTIATIIVAYIAFRVAFFTIKKVVINAVLGGITYLVCVNVLQIPMDIGFGVWALTILFGPVPMILAALYYGL